jgi:uncharacterized protein (UPF0335 family)
MLWQGLRAAPTAFVHTAEMLKLEGWEIKQDIHTTFHEHLSNGFKVIRKDKHDMISGACLPI